MKQTRTLSTRAITSIGVASAVSFVLMQLNFNLPIAPAFLKLDFSDVPALIMSFSIGPLAGVLTELIKNILNLFVTTTMGVGELSNFILGSMFVFSAGLVYRRSKTRKNSVIAMLIGTLCFALGGILSNLFVMFPFYTMVSGISMDTIIAMCSKILPFVDNKYEVIFFSVTPFNILKATLISVATFFLYKRITPVIKGKC